MRKTLATLALAAVPALILSACNGSAGGSGASAIPNAAYATNGGKVHHNDSGPQDLHAGGATFPGYAYNLGNQPVGPASGPQAPPGTGSLFAAYGGTGTIYYCLTGSGFGRSEFESNNGTATVACAGLGDTATGFGARTDPLDFVGSDVAMASTECCASGTTYANGRLTGSVQWGQPFEFPSIGGPIVYGYRAGDFGSVSHIKLSTWTYCAIANGVIGDWNDGAITADNGGSVTGGVSEPITFYYRSDKSGTTYLYTYHLTQACNQSFSAPYNSAPYGSPSRSAAWTHSFGQSWTALGAPNGLQNSGGTFVGENGNPGVLASIQSTPFATGYVEGAWAKSANPKVAQALLQDDAQTTFVDPTNKTAVTLALKKVTKKNISFGMGSDGISLGSSAPWCQLYIDPSNWNYPHQAAGAYPIVGVTYLLFYGNNNGVHVSDKTKLVNFITSSAAGTVLKKIEYIPLASSVHTAILSALNGTTGRHGHPACLQ
jgi:phosphate transport system substrate-binding protein